mgnify:CR=1 FL=1
MPFTATLNSDNLVQTAYDTLQIVDASTWGVLTAASFSSRKITLQDSSGGTPAGYTTDIDFPLVSGLGDTLDIAFPLDLALTIILTYVPLVADPSSSFTRTITTVFAGNAKSLYSSRVTKSEISDTVRTASKPQYRATTTVLSNLIDSAEYEASVGNLASAQSLLDQANTFDTDIITR